MLGSLDSDLGRGCGARCRERPKSARPSSIHHQIAVDDLDEVRQALGYKQINLYGTSYGTRVAQVYMRRHPSSLRTVSMKGIVPPSMAAPATHARAGEDAWNQLLKSCQADEQCVRSYPTLDADLRTLLKRLEESPELELPPVPNGPSKIRVSPGLFAEAFRFFLYSPESAVRAPKLLRDLVTNKPGLAENALGTRVIFGSERLAQFLLSGPVRRIFPICQRTSLRSSPVRLV